MRTTLSPTYEYLSTLGLFFVAPSDGCFTKIFWIYFFSLHGLLRWTVQKNFGWYVIGQSTGHQFESCLERKSILLKILLWRKKIILVFLCTTCFISAGAGFKPTTLKSCHELGNRDTNLAALSEFGSKTSKRWLKMMPNIVVGRFVKFQSFSHEKLMFDGVWWL